MFRPLISILLVGLLITSLGCDRSPEDLEEWRTAQGGLEQISAWVQDDSEPMDVRERGMQILVEEGIGRHINNTLDGIEDEETRLHIASAAMPTVNEMWEAQDFPELTDELLEDGGEIAPDGDQSIRAVDALYHLTPHLEGEDRERAQEILRDWISQDQEARTQWADTRIPLLAPLAGPNAYEGVASWIHDAYDPGNVANSLRRHVPEDEHEQDAHRAIDAAVAERALEEFPDLSDRILRAIDGAESDGIVPFIEEVLAAEQVDDQLFQLSVNILGDVLTADNLGPLAEALTHHQGLRRWAVATNMLDAAGVAGLVAIGENLPTDPDAYDGDDNEFQNRAEYLCNYTNTGIDEEEFDADPDGFVQLMEMDRWPAQVLGLQCAWRTGSDEVLEAVEALSDDSTSIPAWENGLTVGELASAVARDLADDGDED